MFLKVYKEDIIEGVQRAANIIPSKSGATYLRSIWLRASENKLEIMATDSSIEFRGTYTAEVLQEGLAGVQGRHFVELLRKWPSGQSSLKTDAENGNLLIEQGERRKYNLPTNETMWFQNFSEFPENGSSGPVVWAGDFLQEIIENISFCISDDDAMDAIACLYMKPVESGHIEVCGLNGHQFAMVRFLNDDLRAMLPADGILIQKKYLGELKKWLGSGEIELNMLEKRLFFRTGDHKEMLSLPLSAYQYPDYMNFMSKIAEPDVAKLTVNRKDIFEALERLLVFNNEHNRCTYFDMSSNELLLSSTANDVGSARESLDVEYSGGIQKIAFPTRNVIEILSHYKSEKITFTLTGSEGPCGISGPDDADYMVIIMPMKIVDSNYYNSEEQV